MRRRLIDDIRRAASFACRIGALAVLTAALSVHEARAQVTAPVPLEARAYDQLARLRALGLLDLLPAGQRPYSRRFVAHLVAEGWNNLPRLAPADQRRAVAERLLTELSTRYGVSPTRSASVRMPPGFASRLDGSLADGTWLESPPRPIAGAGMTFMDASINPLVDARGGRRFANGFTASMEFAASAELGGHLAVSAQPRVAATSARGGDAGALTEIRRLALAVGAANVELSAGRMPLQLGQGIHGGLLASMNAPALDMLHVGNDLPAYMPGFLRRMGPVRGQLFIADLGPEQNHPHARLAGWKVSLWPMRSLEIGVSVLAQTGGDGAPGATFGERVVDLLPLVDVLLFQDRDLLFSNKLAGVDARWRHGSGMDLYADAMVDDFDIRRVRSSLWEDAGLVAGLVLPPLGPRASVRVEAEVQHTGLRFYEHAQFSSGVTFRQTLIGLPLGPRGDAVAARLGWETSPDIEWTGALAVEQRSEDQYMTTSTGPDDSGFRFVKVEDRPEERRIRALLGLRRRIGAGGLRIEAEGGGEHVRNAAFADGASRTNYMGRIAVVSGF